MIKQITMKLNDLRLIFALLPISLIVTGFIFGFNFFNTIRLQLINDVYGDTNGLLIGFMSWIFLSYVCLLVRHFIGNQTHVIFSIALLTLNTMWLLIVIVIAYTAIAAFGFGFILNFSDIPTTGDRFMVIIKVCTVAFTVFTALEIYFMVRLIRKMFVKAVPA